MVEMVKLALDRESGSEERLLPENAGDNGGAAGDRSWRLNFEGYQVSPQHKEKPPRKIHDCLGVLGNFVPFFLLFNLLPY